MGQFFTPPELARFMASMFQWSNEDVHLLDAGAGVGSLTAAFVDVVSAQRNPPRKILISAYEIDPILVDRLNSTLRTCQAHCQKYGIDFHSEVLQQDFVEAAVDMLSERMFSATRKQFNYAILNPPYRKIRADSRARKLLRTIGIETSNLYAAFLALVIHLLRPGGQLVAITPRSFCNGPYFRSFRSLLFARMRLRRVHIFDARDRAFREDVVLQENIVFHALKGETRSKTVVISSSYSPEDELVSTRVVPHESVVFPGDPELFIHLSSDELQAQLAQQAAELPSNLGALGLSVSTGRVVEFRAKTYIRNQPGERTVPLIYPRHFSQGFIKWPTASNAKPNAILDVAETSELVVPSGTYVLVKRFTSKEERRRLVAAIYDPKCIDALKVGFENHVNFYHSNGRGMAKSIAKGLALFLNSTIADAYLRHFSGHTQVNAADLRKLRYPTLQQLQALGSNVRDTFPPQEEIDRHIDREVFAVPKKRKQTRALRAKRKIAQGLHVLKALGLPRQQQNERSALTLLSLLDLKPTMSWRNARNPLCGITPMMDFFRDNYGKNYAPNTRETVRRQTVHQFQQAGLVIANPDDPSRPVNSPKAVYQIEASLLRVLRAYNTDQWENRLRTYLTKAGSLSMKYARERKMKKIRLTLALGKRISLSPGGQNLLVKQIVNEFCPRFTPGGQFVYVGDARKKWAYFDEDLLAKLGVAVDPHGKMPDVLLYHRTKNWLVVIEAVTTHGPVNPKRRGELSRLLGSSTAGLVFVTAFPDRHSLTKHLNEISWETEVWVAESPTHLVHFNGERFLGPYD